MNKKCFIYRCKCCGATFYRNAKDLTGAESTTLQKISKLEKFQIHICDESTSLVGIGELIGGTDITR